LSPGPGARFLGAESPFLSGNLIRQNAPIEDLFSNQIRNQLKEPNMKIIDQSYKKTTNPPDEIIVELKNGMTLRSSSTDRLAGDYVCLCNEDGKEIAYWHHDEWQTDPILVMGAIMCSAAGITIKQKQDNNENH
jgi:hypothetical protein